MSTGSSRRNSTVAPSRSVAVNASAESSLSIIVIGLGIPPVALGPDDQHRALGMPDDGVAMWPDETRDLVGLAAADYGELYRSVQNGGEVGNIVWDGCSADLYTGVPSAPALHPTV